MINFKLKSLNKGEKLSANTLTDEVAIVILSGRCDISINNGRHFWRNLGKRNTVFEGTPDTVYVPCNTNYCVTSLSSNMRIAILSTYGEVQYSPFLVRNEDVTPEIRGDKEWKRSVYDIITTNHNVNSLIVGETIHTDGVWSGYPPHKHDTDNGNNESKNAEIYYVELEPKEAFAIFLQYGTEWEKTILLRNGDSVTVEDGYHAIVSAGGSKFYYLWALDSKHHRFICKTDDKFRWVK